MKRKLSFLFPVVGAALLVLSACEKTPSLRIVPLKEFHETLDAKEIFRRSDSYNISGWVVPDGKGDLKIQLGKESKSLYLWTRNHSPLGFSMHGGVEKKTVRIDIPPIGESASMEVPFSFEVPWSLSADSVPDIFKRLFEIGLYQSGEFCYDFGEDMPFSQIAPDIRLLLPSCMSPDPEGFDILPEENGYRFYVWCGDEPSSEDVSMVASFEVPEEYQSLPDHAIRVDSHLTVRGTLHLEKKALKEGREWPDHLDFSFSFAHEGHLFRAKGQFNFPSTYTIPDISHRYALQIRPYLFQEGSPNIHLYDTRIRLDFLNRSPFHVRLRGTVASYKEGKVLHSIPFGDDSAIEAIPYDTDRNERVCEKYGLAVPLRYSTLHAQQAVISLLTLNRADPVLEPEQKKNAQKYLQGCKAHPADHLSLKHKIEWWALENSSTVACLFGHLSLWADAKKQKRIFKK